ncbi:hypothetical protein WA158_005556 [Blastocystis sp. Blastoise]
MSGEDFYIRYYNGHKGQYGNEYMQFEFHADGQFIYENNSSYKSEQMIRKKANVNKIVIDEVKRLIRESQVSQEDDSNWPQPNDDGRQDLECVIDNVHFYFTCSKINSMADIQKSKDPEGLRSFFYLVQDLKCLVISLIGLHYKIKPIP